MLSSDNKEALFSLVRLGIGHDCGIFPESVDWKVLDAFVLEQGLEAVVLDGVERLPAEKRPPVPVLRQWISETLQEYEGRYGLYRRTIAELAAFYNAHGFKMMVLKGYACGLDWPRPEHRPCGDIDIWLFGRQKEADACLESIEGFKIDRSHHHHTVFYRGDFMVENHYDFINTRAHRSSIRFEEKLKELAWKGCREKELDGAKVYLPGADFNFLFMLRHMANHFVGKNMMLRQLLDWAFMVEHNHKEIDWEEDLAFLEASGLLRYFNLMALMCVERLGFSRDIFHCGLKEDALKERVFNDIIEPEYNVPIGRRALRIIVGKTRRWWNNRWKHRLCYPDSLLSGFFYGLWAKIQKPAHILH